MGKEILVVALGRNAFGTTLPEQKKAVKGAAKAIACRAKSAWESELKSPSPVDKPPCRYRAQPAWVRELKHTIRHSP